MEKWVTLLTLNLIVSLTFGQYDWDNFSIAPSPGSGMIWELQTAVSDDFNYNAPAVSGVDTLGGKWINFYHNAWTGPLPTIWKRDHVKVENGNFQILTSRPPGDSVVVDGQTLAVTNLGCATSVHQIQYPVYVESYVKIMNSVLASDVWLLSSDDTQEIDICEAYGSDRWTNPWLSEERLHLSHHVFILNPFQDWQPSDQGSFYTDGSTIWRDDYHTIGVYWIDSVNLEYYVDGQLVRTRSGMEEIDPLYHTNTVDPGDPTNDTRTGLSKPMDIILNTEDQTWRALQGLTPTETELMNAADHTFEIDWIRVYKPIVVDQVTMVSVDGVAAEPCSSTIPVVTVDANNMSLDVVFDLGGTTSGFVQIEHVYTEDFVTFNTTPSNSQFFDPVNPGTGQINTVNLDATVFDGLGTTFNYIQFTFWEPGFTSILGQCQFFINLNVVSLPVELTSFSGQAINRNNLLKWQTASELNNSHFDIERSVDGENFEMIGTVQGKGTTSSNRKYNFVDTKPMKDTYYRLRQVDFDGTFDYSDIIFINRKYKSADTEVVVFPNLVKDRLTVVLNRMIEEELTIKIIDIAGRIISKKNVDTAIDGNTIDLNLSTIASGTYFVKVTSASFDSIQKIIKQ